MIIQAWKENFGVKVSDSWKDQKWVDLNSIDPNLNQVNLTLNQEVINQRREDHLVWGGTPSGIYFVAFVVLILSQSQDSSPYWAKA